MNPLLPFVEVGVFSDEINTDLTAFLIMFSIEDLKRKNNLSIFFLINLLGSEQLQNVKIPAGSVP